MVEITIDSQMEGCVNGRIDEVFRLQSAAKLAVRAFDRSSLSVTELKYDAQNYGMTDVIVKEDAYLVGVQLKPVPFHELWLDGKVMPIHDMQVGDTLLYDLKSVEAARLDVPFHSLHFYLSRYFLDELSDDLECPRIDQLHARRGVPTSDAFFLRMVHAVQPALERPIEANELFASHAMLAFGLYAADKFGDFSTPRPSVGGLSKWQERMAKELIEANLQGGISIQELAKISRLSTSRFAHGFKTTTGMPPHRWLLLRRVRRAEAMLRQPLKQLADIALACGFADQAHFSRVFRQATGYTPGDWRRTQS